VTVRIFSSFPPLVGAGARTYGRILQAETHEKRDENHSILMTEAAFMLPASSRADIEPIRSVVSQPSTTEEGLILARVLTTAGGTD
jgi:hypothetical protein